MAYIGMHSKDCQACPLGYAEFPPKSWHIDKPALAVLELA